jgi:hypothetical protein
MHISHVALWNFRLRFEPSGLPPLNKYMKLCIELISNMKSTIFQRDLTKANEKVCILIGEVVFFFSSNSKLRRWTVDDKTCLLELTQSIDKFDHSKVCLLPKRRERPRTPTGIRLTSLDSITYTPSHKLSVVSLTCYNSRITMQNHTMQLPITQMVRPNLMSHNTKTIRPVASDWTSTMYLQSQTSRTDTIRLHKSTSCLLFHRKHSDCTSFQTLAII